MIINLQISNIDKNNIPKKKQFKYWISFILKKFKMHEYEITIRIIDELESKKINMYYRKKNNSTNIISFPFYKNQNTIKILFLGDLLVCSKLVEKEANYFKKELLSHWAHIIVHGCLHLIGYNHNSKIEKKKMESIEIETMLYFGYKNPYIF